jgi:hypothetical protein
MPFEVGIQAAAKGRFPPLVLLMTEQHYKNLSEYYDLWWCQTNANHSLQGQRGCCLSRTENTPLGERSGTVQLEIDA